MESCTIDAVLFDFGGVIAEEGFRKGLEYIALKNGLNPDEFFETARDLTYSSGYLTGNCSEQDYWNQLRSSTGIKGNDKDLKQIMFERFIIRDWMLDLLRSLKQHSIRVVILSDQTNWLDELEQQYHFSRFFEHVFNSYHIGKTKADPRLFEDVLGIMELSPGQALFIDDSIGHIQRAKSIGLHTIHYTEKEQFLKEMQQYFPEITLPD
jgi:HAD superfamily hydrolase (TIGR01509 family)